ncbi:MAG: hypothetical protein JSV64_04450 [Candidatus Bathyarchaeota archaeon]|nr:MAG: hypothetical protein JSV64_04450 [Candidatus Bathyarchaeota archaeon]
MSAYLMFIAGSVLFVGGVIETLFVAERVEWLSFVPIGFSTSPGCLLGLSLTLGGLALMVFGLAAGTYFARDRSWYIRQLHETNSAEGHHAIKRKRAKAKQAR